MNVEHLTDEEICSPSKSTIPNSWGHTMKANANSKGTEKKGACGGKLSDVKIV